MKALPCLQLVYLDANHIGGRGAALLWNQSIRKCCNLSLNFNIIGDDSPDPFINALKGTINSGYEKDMSCQLVVSMLYNKLLCSDLDNILTISKKLPKGVTLITGDYCLEVADKILKRFEYYVGENYLPSFQDILSISFFSLGTKK